MWTRTCSLWFPRRQSGGSKLQAAPSSSPPPFRLRALRSLNCPSPPTTPSRQRSVNNVAAEPGSPSSFLASRGPWASPTPDCRHTTLPPAPRRRPSDPAVINLASGGHNGHSLSPATGGQSRCCQRSTYSKVTAGQSPREWAAPPLELAPAPWRLRPVSCVCAPESLLF